MTDHRARRGLVALQWILGLVIFMQAAVFAFSPASAHAFAKTGLPNVVRRVLAWAEMAAAVVFLIPRTVVIGGLLLIVVLARAVVLHLLPVLPDVCPLFVYAPRPCAVMSAHP